MRPKTVGYIVTHQYGVMGLYEYAEHPRGGVLLFGKAATLFPTRRRATGAISRTIFHGLANGNPWTPEEQRKFRVLRIEDHPHPAKPQSKRKPQRKS